MNILIVLNYNDYETTASFVELIKNYSSLDKIIIVDNYSTNNSFKILQKYKNNKIDIIQTEVNRGYAYGNNFGVRHAEKCYNPKKIIISNPDIIVSDQTINHLCEFLDSNVEVAFVTGLLYDKYNNVCSNYAWRLPKYRNMLFNSFVILSKLFNRITNEGVYKPDEDVIQKVDVVSGCFFVIKYDIFKRIGMFDERTFLYGEETILAYKLKAQKFEGRILLKEKIVHLHGETVKKSIRSWQVQMKYNFESHLIYLEYYLKVSKIQMIIYFILFNIGKYERYLVTILKDLKDEYYGVRSDLNMDNKG